MMHLISRFVPLLGVLLLTFHSPCQAAETRNFKAILKEFSSAQRTLSTRLIEQLDLSTPASLGAFYYAADTGDWLSVSNSFNEFRKGDTWSDGVQDAIMNELWAPVLETYGAYEVAQLWHWDSELLAAFYGPILESMPTNSIYFGGTDQGRFLITAANAVREPPKVICLTQNALADNTYMAHLRAVFADQIWLPTQDEVGHAFRRFIEEINSGKRENKGAITTKNGRVQVSGVLGVMELNGILCEEIFKNNRDDHEFYIEESYVIAWMYPYLEPNGLIMKLNRAKLSSLSDRSVRQDMEYWEETISKLKAMPAFNASFDAKRDFAKLRCAIAGIYRFHGRYADAESCFTQARELSLSSPEVYFRHAKMQEARGKISEAINIMHEYIALDTATMESIAKDSAIHSMPNARAYIASLTKLLPKP